jgi:uncharacterized protein with von Willebrand factor type A (vWA) domain
LSEGLGVTKGALTVMDTFFKYLGELVLYGGGAVAIAFAMFRILGQKWLDAKFAERLQALKGAQDEQLRYVQGFIDREIHRARRLYDREFEALPEAWRLLCTSFRNGQATGMDLYPQLARYTKKELADFLSTTSMREFERDEMLEMDPSRWTEQYRRWNNIQRLNTYWKERRDFQDFLTANAIFFSSGLKERFLAIDGLVGMAIAEMDGRLRSSNNHSYDQVSKLHADGPALLAELEVLIQNRLWSSDAANSNTAIV